MKKILYLLSVIIAIFVVVACQDKPDVYEFPVDEYYYEIPDVPVTEDYVVGAPYNIIDSGYWFNKSTGKAELYTGHPKLGEYNLKHDPSVLPQQLEWGKEAGIDFFIISWGGHGWNDTLLTTYGELYKEGYPKVVIRFDPGYRFGKTSTDTLMRNKLQMDSIRRDFDSLYTHVMTKPYAYKNKSGIPVMVLTNLNNTGNIPSLNKFTEFLRNTVQNKVWIMGEVGGNWSSPEYWGYRDSSTKGVIKGDTISAVDAVFITDITTGNKDRFDGFYSFMDYNYKYWQDRMRPLNKEYIPTIFPSFDNLVREPSSNTYLIPRYNEAENKAYIVSAAAGYQDNHQDKQYNLSNYLESPYKTLANVAKRNVGDSRILLVYSWNDYRIGNNLEPTTETGDDYLKYTRKYFKK